MTNNTVYIIFKRVYSERARHHAGYQPYVWKVLDPPYGEMHNFPKSRPALKALIHRLLARFGAGRYRVNRSSFGLEMPHWRPVLYFQVRADGKFRIVKKYSEFKSHEGTERDQGYWKEPHKRLLVTQDMNELLREKRRRTLEKLTHRDILKTKPKVHEIRSHSSRPWVVRAQADTLAKRQHRY